MAGKRKRVQEQAPNGKAAAAADTQHENASGDEQPAYSSKEYWDRRYADKVPYVPRAESIDVENSNALQLRDACFQFDLQVSHEWYFGYQDLKALFDQFADKAGSCLDIGCGDKPMVRLQQVLHPILHH